MIELPISSLAALANMVIFLTLTWAVIRLRRAQGVVLGDGEDRALQKAIRGQGNASEQMPLALILMLLAELQGAPALLLIPAALLFTAGRALHGVYFGLHGTHWSLRMTGMAATLLGQGLLVLCLLVAAMS